MDVIRALQRPEYIRRPTQIIRRLAYSRLVRRDEVTIDLPWRLPITVCPRETLGRAICTLGLDDLAVCEVLWRLMPRGGIAVDVGANLGQMTSLLARRAGPQGAVIAIEPERRNLSFLRRNVAAWGPRRETAPITILDCAATDFDGEITLYLPPAMQSNRGLASIVPGSEPMEEQTVRAATLSSLLRDFPRIDLLKIDVEGAEDRVLDGYAAQLAAGGVDTIVAEEQRPLPSPLTSRLVMLGYAVFRIDLTFRQLLLKPADGTFPPPSDQANNIIAVRNAASALAALRAPGWQVLSSR